MNREKEFNRIAKYTYIIHTKLKFILVLNLELKYYF